MNSVSNSRTQRSWDDFYTYKKSSDFPQIEFAYVREGMHNELMEYFHEQERTAFEADIAASKKETNSVKLSSDKVNELAGKYNPRQMSRDEFRAFLREMVDMGVITEVDYNIMGYGIAPLFSPATVCGIRSGNLNDSPYYIPGNGMPMNYDQSGGDILAWFSMESTFHSIDPFTGNRYLSNRDRSFGRVASVLEQMDQQSPASRQISYQQSHQTSRLAFDLKSRIAAPATAVRR